MATSVAIVEGEVTEDVATLVGKDKTGPMDSHHPGLGPTTPHWPTYPQWPPASPWPNQAWQNSVNQPRLSVANQHSTSSSNNASGILGHAPTQNGTAYLSTHAPSVTTSPPIQNTDFIPTTLANAFNSMTFSDLSDAAWYMDIGATPHLTAQSGSLFSLSTRSNLPLITVGNGSLLPAIASGHTFISSISHPLYLHNVLLCPKILKNLIYVR